MGNDRAIETTEMGQHHRHMQMIVQDMVATKQGIVVVNNREEKTLSGACRERDVWSHFTDPQQPCTSMLKVGPFRTGSKA